MPRRYQHISSYENEILEMRKKSNDKRNSRPIWVKSRTNKRIYQKKKQKNQNDRSRTSNSQERQTQQKRQWDTAVNVKAW